MAVEKADGQFGPFQPMGTRRTASQGIDQSHGLRPCAQSLLSVRIGDPTRGSSR